MRTRMVAIALAALAVAGAAVGQDLTNEDCMMCHGKPDAVVEFSDGEVSAYVDPKAYLRSVHGRLSCVECHTQVGGDEDHPDRDLPSRRDYTLEMNRACQRCHGASTADGVADGAARIMQVVHPAGSAKTPVCTDCHQTHQTRVAAFDGVTISHGCKACHAGVFAEFSKSAHGAAFRTENPDLPVCTSCHVGHENGGKSPAARRVRLGRPCIGCHADGPLMAKYDLSPNVVTSYLKDFHGVSLKFYEQEHHDIGRYPLVCADCHGIHGVTAMHELEAGAMKANVATACNKCHENAAASFPDAWLSHYEPSLSKNPLVFLAKIFYWVLIPFVIVGLLIHIVLHLVVLPIRTRRRRARGATAPPSATPANENKTGVPSFLPRFSRRQRSEHAIVMVTFIILIVTGLPQKFHDAGWATTMVGWLGGIDLVRIVHRVAGWAFAAAAVIHFFTVGGGIVLGKMKMNMVPKLKDFRDAITSLRYYLGFAPAPPRADRYDYRQKFEYWGMVMGGVIMAVTGLILIYPLFFARYLPGQFIPVAKTVHSYEAVMALLTIIIWHMYGARFDRSIFTGKIATEKLAHHHPLEYERMVRRLCPARTDDAARPASAARVPHRRPVADASTSSSSAPC